ncbi:hypothetical protein ACJX0J_010768 [Zea mays]
MQICGNFYVRRNIIHIYFIFLIFNTQKVYKDLSIFVFYFISDEGTFKIYTFIMSIISLRVYILIICNGDETRAITPRLLIAHIKSVLGVSNNLAKALLKLTKTWQKTLLSLIISTWSLKLCYYQEKYILIISESSAYYIIIEMETLNFFFIACLLLLPKKYLGHAPQIKNIERESNIIAALFHFQREGERERLTGVTCL